MARQTFTPAQVLTASQMNTLQSSVWSFDINAQTGTTYTTVITDVGKTITTNNVAGVTVTIPPETSVNYEVGSIIKFMNLGAGNMTVAAGVGVTINTVDSLTLVKNETAILQKTATNTFVFSATSGGSPSLQATITTTSTYTPPAFVSNSTPLLATVVYCGGGAGGVSRNGASIGGSGFGVCTAGGSGGRGGNVQFGTIAIFGSLSVVIGAAGTNGGGTATNGGSTYISGSLQPALGGIAQSQSHNINAEAQPTAISVYPANLGQKVTGIGFIMAGAGQGGAGGQTATSGGTAGQGGLGGAGGSNGAVGAQSGVVTGFTTQGTIAAQPAGDFATFTGAPGGGGGGGGGSSATGSRAGGAGGSNGGTLFGAGGAGGAGGFATTGISAGTAGSNGTGYGSGGGGAGGIGSANTQAYPPTTGLVLGGNGTQGVVHIFY